MSKLMKEIQQIPSPVFSRLDLQKVSQLKETSLKVALSRAIKSGDVLRLANGFYATSVYQISWEQLAVSIYGPGYVSFESALGYYNILNQQSAELTVATTRRGKTISIRNQNIFYRHIREDLFWGYIQKEKFLLAEPEKAFLDLAYLSLNGYAYFDPEEMNLALLNTKKIKTYLIRFKSTKLKKLINNLMIEKGLLK